MTVHERHLSRTHNAHMYFVLSDDFEGDDNATAFMALPSPVRGTPVTPRASVLLDNELVIGDDDDPWTTKDDWNSSRGAAWQCSEELSVVSCAKATSMRTHMSEFLGWDNKLLNQLVRLWVDAKAFLSPVRRVEHVTHRRTDYR